MFGWLFVFTVTCYLNVFAQRPTSGASYLVNFKLRPYLRFVSSTYCMMILIYPNFWVCFLDAMEIYITKRSLNVLNILVFGLLIKVICEVLLLLHISTM